MSKSRMEIANYLQSLLPKIADLDKNFVERRIDVTILSEYQYLIEHLESLLDEVNIRSKFDQDFCDLLDDIVAEFRQEIDNRQGLALAILLEQSINLDNTVSFIMYLKAASQHRFNDGCHVIDLVRKNQSTPKSLTVCDHLNNFITNLHPWGESEAIPSRIKEIANYEATAMITLKLSTIAQNEFCKHFNIDYLIEDIRSTPYDYSLLQQYYAKSDMLANLNAEGVPVRYINMKRLSTRFKFISDCTPRPSIINLENEIAKIGVHRLEVDGFLLVLNNINEKIRNAPTYKDRKTYQEELIAGAESVLSSLLKRITLIDELLILANAIADSGLTINKNGAVKENPYWSSAIALIKSRAKELLMKPKIRLTDREYSDFYQLLSIHRDPGCYERPVRSIGEFTKKFGRPTEALPERIKPRFAM